MLHKKIMACLLLCCVTQSCLGMKYVEGAVTAVKNGYNTANEKMYPTEIFGKIHAKWATANERKKVTLLHKLDRGFLDGLILDPELTKLLDAIEDTIPKYPVCHETLSLLHQHIVVKLPTLEERPNIKLRALKAMYLIKPEQLAVDILRSRFSNYVADNTQRETIVSVIAQSIIKSGNATQANQLVSALEDKKEVPFGTTAQADLKAFLCATAFASFKSCEYIDKLGNTKEDENLKRLAIEAQERAKYQQERISNAQENKTREEKAYAEQLKVIQAQSNKLREEIGKESALTEALKAEFEKMRLAREAAQRVLEQESADNSNNE